MVDALVLRFLNLFYNTGWTDASSTTNERIIRAAYHRELYYYELDIEEQIYYDIYTKHIGQIYVAIGETLQEQLNNAIVINSKDKHILLTDKFYKNIKTISISELESFCLDWEKGNTKPLNSLILEYKNIITTLNKLQVIYKSAPYHKFTGLRFTLTPKDIDNLENLLISNYRNKESLLKHLGLK